MPTPTPQITNSNDDDNTIIHSNCSKSHRTDTTATTCHYTQSSSTTEHNMANQANPSKINIPICNGISDSGTTGHFVLQGAPVKNIKITANPIAITLPDGQKIHSTHTCDLDIPWLPKSAVEAHIVPGLAHTPLISIKNYAKGDVVLFST